MGLVLDSGALIAFERGDRGVAALVEAARRKRLRTVTSSGCVAQVWRGPGPRQSLLARLLRGLTELALDENVSKAVGHVCAVASTNDVVDAHVAHIARDGDVVVTADAADLRRLMRATRCRAEVRGC